MKLTYDKDVEPCLILTISEAIYISLELDDVILKIEEKYQKYLAINKSGSATKEERSLLYYFENKLDTLKTFKKLVEH